MSYKESIITLVHHRADDPKTVEGNLPDGMPEFSGWHILSCSYDVEVGIGAVIITRDFTEQIGSEQLGGILYALGSLGEGFVRNLVIVDHEGKPIPNASPAAVAREAEKSVRVEWTVPMLRRFKISYDAAVSGNRDNFTFDGIEFVTGYAKYLLEYLSAQFGVKL